ncbi:MAG: hypothetical protein JOY92_10060 [Verrucomicrobia bacterium]|nr:hypothetical protein [Verrucomicrobiota bacterium]
MFYLSGNDFPQSAQELESSLLRSLRTLFTFPSGESRPVRVEDRDYPEVDRIRVDLSGTATDARQPPPKPAGVGQRRPGVHASQLEIFGHPIRIRGAGMHLDLSAGDVSFDYDRDHEGHPLLVLAAAEAGRVAIEISRGDLEALLLAEAKTAAAKQGVAVENAALDLVPINQRSVAIAARVTAKKLIARATVEVKGQLAVDDELNATLSALSCAGEGIVGGLAGNLIRPYLERFNNTKLPLAAVSLGTIHLHDLRIGAGDSLKVQATFGR